MPDYWDTPGNRRTNNSSQRNQSVNHLPILDMTVNNNTTASAIPSDPYIIDPFAADINPGSAKGQKLFVEACAPVEESKKMTANIENQHLIMARITSLVQRFRWGQQVLAIRLASDQSAAKSMLTENHDISIKDLKLQAYKIWGGGADTATEIPVVQSSGRRDLVLTDLNITSTSSADDKKVFHARVRSTMIRRAIEGRFDDKTLKIVRLHSKDYSWHNPATGEVEEDGVTMLKVLIDILKPSLKKTTPLRCSMQWNLPMMRLP